jgi:hypothetical protein
LELARENLRNDLDKIKKELKKWNLKIISLYIDYNLNHNYLGKLKKAHYQKEIYQILIQF